MIGLDYSGSGASRTWEKGQSYGPQGVLRAMRSALADLTTQCRVDVSEMSVEEVQAADIPGSYLSFSSFSLTR